MVDAENYVVTGFPFPFSSTISWKEMFLPRGGGGDAFFLHWCLCSSIPFDHIISLKFWDLLPSKVPTSSAPSCSISGGTRWNLCHFQQQVRRGVRLSFIKFNPYLVPNLALHCQPREEENSPKSWVDYLLKCPHASKLRKWEAMKRTHDKLPHPMRNSPQCFDDGFLKVQGERTSRGKIHDLHSSFCTYLGMSWVPSWD